MKKRYLTIFAIAIVALFGVGMVSAFGFGKGMEFSNDADMQEHREAVMQAIENNDYVSWRALMEAELSEENFNSMVEMHNEREEFREKMEEARENGDFEAMEELRGDSGFGRNGPRGDCPFME